jgi:hypothetical protein
MPGPMCVLYELCIWLAYFDHKKKAALPAAADADSATDPAPDLHEPEGEEGEDRSDLQHEPWDPSSLEEGRQAGKESQGEDPDTSEPAAEKPSVVTDHLPEEEQEDLDDTPPESIPGEEVRRMRDLSGDEGKE